MKRLVVIGMVVVLLALDWAALHDILKGEPDVRGELAMLALSAVVFAGLILSQERRTRRT
jgi:hypothetical protein